jgi:hypothetical protein
VGSAGVCVLALKRFWTSIAQTSNSKLKAIIAGKSLNGARQPANRIARENVGG